MGGGEGEMIERWVIKEVWKNEVKTQEPSALFKCPLCSLWPNFVWFRYKWKSSYNWPFHCHWFLKKRIFIYKTSLHKLPFNTQNLLGTKHPYASSLLNPSFACTHPPWHKTSLAQNILHQKISSTAPSILGTKKHAPHEVYGDINPPFYCNV